MLSDSEPSSAEIQAGLNGVVRDMLRPGAAMLAGAYLLYTLAHALQVPPGPRGLMILLDGATALAGAGLWVYFSRVRVRLESANRWALGMVALALANFAFQVYLTPSPALAVFLVLIVVGAGCFLLSWGYMTASVLASVGVWTAGVLLNPEGDWWGVARIVVVGVILGLLVHGLRWRSYRRYEVLKYQLQRTADRLEQRLRFEQILTRVSTQFLDMSTREIDREIVRAMQAIGECLEIEHVCVCRVEGEPPELRLIEEWCHSEATPFKPRLMVVPVHRLPWSWGRLEANENVHMIRVSEAPEAAQTDREFLKQNGICSFFAVPLAVAGRTWGLLTLTTEKGEAAWPEEAANLLRVLGEIIVASLKRKTAEEEISNLNRQLEQASRLVGLGEMAANLAHDLGNGLTFILQFTEGAEQRLQRGTFSPEQSRQCITNIQEHAQHMRRVLTMMQEFVRTRSTARVPICLPEIIQQTSLLVAGKFREGEIELDVTEPPEVPPVLADPVQISIVLVNLLLNAAQAMASTEPERRCISVAIHNDRTDYVEVSIRDEGPGVPVALREKIFEKFYTTKKNGLGLGLAFSRSYIEEHGGKLWCNSQSKTGCEFRFTLPRCREEGPGQ